MRNAGDRVAGGTSGRRQRPASPEPPPPAGTGAGASLFTPAYRVSHGPSGSPSGSDAAWRGSSGYPGPAGQDYSWPSDYDAGRDASWPGDDLSAGFGWGDDDPSAGAWPGGVPGGRGQARRTGGNAVRGFPPVPGEPLPVYPPGPFEAWNRGLDRAVAPTTGEFPRIVADGEATARITPDEFDTDYSLPAIKDPIPGAATASAGGATITGPAAGTRQNGRPAAPPDLPGEPVRRGGAATQPGTGPSHRTPGRGRAEAAQPAAASPAPATAATPAAKASPATTASTATSITKTKGRRKRRSHWPAIAAAIVIILAVAAVLVYTLPKNSTAGPPPKAHPTSTPTPTASGPTAPPGPWGFIGARKTDATPLTMPEVFPATISDGTTTYTRARQAIGKNCRSSVIGAALQAAVRKAGCSQALRATYLSRTAKVMATIGVFNLKNAAQAGKAAAQAGHSEFVTQLAAKAGPAKAIGQGTGLEEALFKGHYLVLVWAEPTNVNVSPSGKNKSKLDAFMKLLVAHTVNASLSYRMVDGKPPAG